MKRKRNKKITDSARGEDCQVRLEGICNFNPETTIAAHLNGGGMGTKHNDIFIAYCCSSCHDALDGRSQANKKPWTEFTCGELKLAHYDGMVRTQLILLEKRLIVA